MTDFPRIQRPDEADQCPVVVSIPHSGVDVPDEERPYYRIELRGLLLDGDLYTEDLYGDAWTRGATVVSTPYSRFVIDLNRFADDLAPSAVKGTRRRMLDGYYGVRGLIWAVNTHGDMIYHEPLPPAVLERRLSRYYRPYHAAVRSELARLRQKFGIAVLLDAHSMPSRATALHSDTGQIRPDVVPGDVDGTSCAPWLTHLTARFWSETGHAVVPNRPYRGGGITRTHGRPSDGVHAIQVELNRALYMDETTLERSDGLPGLREQCLEFVQTVCERASAMAR